MEFIHKETSTKEQAELIKIKKSLITIGLGVLTTLATKYGIDRAFEIRGYNAIGGEMIIPIIGILLICMLWDKDIK